MKRFNAANDGARLFLSFLALCFAAGSAAAQKPRDIKIEPGRATVWQLAFSPDGKTLAYTMRESQDGRIVLCDVKTGKEQASFSLSSDDMRYALAFNPDGKTIVACVVARANRFKAEVWDIKLKKRTLAFDLDEGEGMRCLFTSDGKTLVVTSEKGAVALYNPLNGKRIASLAGKHSKARWLSLSANDKWLVTGHDRNSVTVWDLTRRREVRSFDLGVHASRLPSYSPPVELEALAISPKGDRIVTAGDDYKITLWDRDSGKRLKTLDAQNHHHLRTDYLSFGKDGKTVLAVGSGLNHGMLIWDPETGAVVGGFYGKRDRKMPIIQHKLFALSPDRKVLATYAKQIIRFYDLPDADEVNKKGKK